MSTNLDRALALHRDGRFDDAAAGYRACLARGEDAAAAPLAALLLQQGRYADAATLLERLVRAAPHDAALAVNLSVALRRAGRIEPAFESARHASTIAPGSAAAWNALGLAALELDRAEAALQAFDRGLALAPGQPALILHRAHALRRAGRNAAALAEYERVVERDPNLTEAWRGLANTQAALGFLDQALRSRQYALQLAPGDPETMLEHAVAVLQTGDAAAAAAQLEALLETDGANAQTWAWLGRARIKLGQIDLARAAFARASAADPADPVIAHYQAALSGALPSGVENQYIRNFFDSFADRFEGTLVGNLAYDLPRRIAAFLQRCGAGNPATILDLGCGTGLMAQALAQPGRAIDGVDLSPRMLEHARAKNLYRQLHDAEILDFLRAGASRWDLVVAADVFIYVADLDPVFRAVHARLSPGGTFVFSIETSASGATELLPQTARYRHAPDLLTRALAATGFDRVAREATVIRLENREAVAGELILAERGRQ